MTLFLFVALALATGTNARADDPCVRGWSALGGGIEGSDATVEALAIFDDGSGPALYAGGWFTKIGGVAAKNLARWDGHTWSAFGSGASLTVNILAVADIGDGPQLYAGGRFDKIDGKSINGIAVLKNGTWQALNGGGLKEYANSLGVLAIAAYDDGGGPALHVGGDFTRAGDGDTKVWSLAKWDGSGWTHPLDAYDKRRSTYGVVGALHVFDFGDGPELVIGGTFDNINNENTYDIARWNGQRVVQIGNGLERTQVTLYLPTVGTLLEYDRDGAARLHAFGVMYHGENGSWYDDSDWQLMAYTTAHMGQPEGDPRIRRAVSLATGAGDQLVVTGTFAKIGTSSRNVIAANDIAIFDGSEWAAIDTGLDFVNYHGRIGRSLAVWDRGRGWPDLIVGGYFPGAGGIKVRGLVQWGCLPLADCNCDGTVDFDDIDAFVLALSDPGAYKTQFPACDIRHADVDGSGGIDFDDIDAFVAKLIR